MRRTYRSKKDTGGGIDHRDLVRSVDAKSSIFDAYYTQNIKQVKREFSCVSSSNPYTTASNKVRKRKYVKRLKEPESFRESSESAYLTPDKSIRVNRIPDLFDQLLNSSNALSPKTTATSDDNVCNSIQTKMPKRTYCRRKVSKAKRMNHSESDSDKENSLSDESYAQNTTNIKAHELIIEKENVFSPVNNDDSIYEVAKNFSTLIKFRKQSTKSASDGSTRFSDVFINVTRSPLLQSPQCSTPFHEKYRGKSIYNFSPIQTDLRNESINNISVLSNPQYDCNGKSQNNSKNNETNTNFVSESPKQDKTQHISDATDNILQEKEEIDESQVTTVDKDNFTNKTESEIASLTITELEPFLGFSAHNSIQTEWNNNDHTVDESIPDNEDLSQESICKSIDNINSIMESSMQCNNESSINVEELDNTVSSDSEHSEEESFYDTCDSENMSDSSSQKEKSKILTVEVEKLSDSVFQKYYKEMVESSLNSTNTGSISVGDNNVSIVSNDNESDYDSFQDVENEDDTTSNSPSDSLPDNNDSCNSENFESVTIEVVSSSENDQSDSNDKDDDNCLSFVTTRRRNNVTNDSFVFNFDNSFNSSSSATLDKTVLSYNKERCDETELIDNTLVNTSAEENVSSDKTKTDEHIETDIQMLPKEDVNSKVPPFEDDTDEEISNINTRRSSRYSEYRGSMSSVPKSIADESINGLRQGIVLKPGKQWERSLSIYRRMTMMGTTFNQSLLDDETLKSKGRKYRQSVISTMEMQEHQGGDSLHNESVFSRRGTFVSKPRRSTFKIFKDPNASRVDLSSSVLYEDLEGFLNGDCDDTVIELSKLSISDSGHEVTVLDKFHDTSNRITTARDYVLRRCNQTEPILFDECYPDPVLKNCRKIGEGVYGEVFLWRAGDGRARVMKIVPIAGATKVNGETQKDYHEIISEIVIAMELSALRAPIPEIERQLDDGKEIDALDLQSVQNATDVFNEVLAIRCVYGVYPSRLLDLWELYDECKGSENDNPAALPPDQQYIVLELANAGQDLESYQFNNAEQAYALFKQIALGLAVGEESFQFEHRDLHWGNVLIAPTDQKYATFVIRGRLVRTARCGVAATLIDYSLSRAARGAGDGAALYNDLADDDALFDAVGDYQFEVYRLMRDKLGNDWKNFEPYTNILWLHYTVDKMITALRYTRPNTKIHKHYIAKLKEIKNRVLEYGSATQFILTDNEF